MFENFVSRVITIFFYYSPSHKQIVMPSKSCKKQRKNNSYDECRKPCDQIICCPCGISSFPPLLTNIAVLGTGPFGPLVTIGFTVVNTTGILATNVVVSISADQVGVSAGAIATSVGSFFNSPGTSLITWNVGALAGGQSASINFNQIGVGAAPNTWTALATTNVPEVTLIDNTATVFVPFPA